MKTRDQVILRLTDLMNAFKQNNEIDLAEDLNAAILYLEYKDPLGDDDREVYYQGAIRGNMDEGVI